MVTRNDQTPGCGQPQPMGRGISVSGIGAGLNIFTASRARARNPGPHPQGIEPPLRHPHTWPQCLGKKSDSSVVSPPTEPAPSISTPSSNTESSGLPSLESITGPEYGYETSPLSSNIE